MTDIIEFLAAEHRDGDAEFAAAEEAAQAGDMVGCRARFEQFQSRTACARPIPIVSTDHVI